MTQKNISDIHYTFTDQPRALNIMDNAYEPEFFRMPFPADYEDEPDADVLSRASAMFGAAESILSLATKSGQTISISEAARAQSLEVFATTDEDKVPSSLPTEVAIHLAAMLSAYDMVVVKNGQQLRNFCTNILIEKAAEGRSESVQLRAVEMLAKIKDVDLFETSSVIHVEHMVTDDIRAALREKINTIRSLTSSQPITDVTITEVPHE